MENLSFFERYSNLLTLIVSILALVVSIISLYFSYFINTKTKVSVKCHLVSDGEYKVKKNKTRIFISFPTKCHVKNIGFRRVDIVEVRTAHTLDGKYETFPLNNSEPKDWELVDNLKINGNELKKPTTIEVGSQAIVELNLNYPIISSNLGNIIKQQIEDCGINNIKSRNDLESC